MQALIEAIEATEAHLAVLASTPTQLIGFKGFKRIGVLADAVKPCYASDSTSKAPFEILARVGVHPVSRRCWSSRRHWCFAERHDNIEAIYKKLTERRDTADVTELLKALHRIVNEAIATQGKGADQAEGLTIDLSLINIEKLREEFAKKVKRKATVVEDLGKLIEKKLAQMLKDNPLRMNYEKKYQEIIAAYNQDKDRATVEDTFAKLMDLASKLDAEQRRAIEEGLSEKELALFDLLGKESMSKAERNRLKDASRELLAEITRLIAPLEQWTEKEQTQAEVEVFVLDHLYAALPDPPYSALDKELLAQRVFRHIWQQSASGSL